MKFLSTLLFVALLVSGTQAQNDSDIQKQIEEKYGDIYMGEPFLSAKRTANDLWFELAGTLSKNIW